MRRWSMGWCSGGSKGVPDVFWSDSTIPWAGLSPALSLGTSYSTLLYSTPTPYTMKPGDQADPDLEVPYVSLPSSLKSGGTTVSP